VDASVAGAWPAWSRHRAGICLFEQAKAPGRHKGGVIGLEGMTRVRPALPTQNSLARLGILKKLPFLPSNALRPEQIMADRCFMLPEDVAATNWSSVLVTLRGQQREMASDVV
jgi:hypothetical protein